MPGVVGRVHRRRPRPRPHRPHVHDPRGDGPPAAGPGHGALRGRRGGGGGGRDPQHGGRRRRRGDRGLRPSPGRGRPHPGHRRDERRRCSRTTAATWPVSSISARHPDVFDGADVVVSGRFVNQRLAPVPLEVNGIVAVPDDDGGTPGLTLWVSHQNPAASPGPGGQRPRAVRRPGADRRPAVGGGFGTKMPLLSRAPGPRQPLARRLGRPVRWVETRSESMTGLAHGRGHVHHVELGARSDGTLVGLRRRGHRRRRRLPRHRRHPADVHPPDGSAACTASPRSTSRPRPWSPTPRRWPPTGEPGVPRPPPCSSGPWTCWPLELDMDPVELRRRNLIPPDAFPHTTATGATYDSGDYGTALDLVLRHGRLRGAPGRAGQAEGGRATPWRSASGSAPTWRSPGPSRPPSTPRSRSSATARSPPSPAPSPTARATRRPSPRSCRPPSACPSRRSRWSIPTPALVPESGGTMGPVRCSSAAARSCARPRWSWNRPRPGPPSSWRRAPGDIVLTDDGRVGVAGSPAQAAVLGASWPQAGDDGRWPPARSWGQYSNTYSRSGPTWRWSRSTPRPGRSSLRRIVAVDDCGRILNPMLVTGQVHGGLAQGIAQALFEEFAYDDDGIRSPPTWPTTLSPPPPSCPASRRPTPRRPPRYNPLGAKGIGESGTIGSTPGGAERGGRRRWPTSACATSTCPLTPERVWRAIQDARNG